MTISNIRKQILERLEPLPGEQVKNLLLQWLINSSGNLEDFQELLKSQSHQKIEELLDYGEIDSGLNFRSLTEEEMIRQSKLALEAYHREGFSVNHDRVREWADSLGTDADLASGKVAGAALDVFEVEPLPGESRLREFDQCIFGTHNASHTKDAVLRVNELAINNLLAGLGVEGYCKNGS